MTLSINYVYDGSNWVRKTVGTAGTAAAQVVTIQGIASMTPILATVTATNLDVQSGGADLATSTQAGAIQTAVELLDNAVSGSGFNISQINGVTPLMGAGNTGTGSHRTTEATDSQLSAGVGATGDAAATAGSTGSINAKLRLLTTDIDAIKTAIQLLDNAVSGSGYNITQMNGVNVSMNSGAHGTGTQRVSVAGPCADPARITHAAISESTAATNEIVALNGSDLIYVCSYKWVTTAANSLNWTRGTGTDCATGPAAIEGAQPFAANGGVVESGGGHPLFVVPAGNALCLVSSAATAHGGRVSYVRTATP
jgi:hypothetical protein